MSLKPTKYVVTGAAGFIGAAVARHLLEQGHRVITIDNLSTGFEENLPSGIEFIKGDCQDADAIAKLGDEPPQAILHIAGQSSGEISFENPVYDLQTNAQSTLLLLDYARRVGCSRFVYASTMSVYGAQPDRAITETATCSPTSFYGVGKLASEHYLRIYAKFGISSVILRLYNVYGFGQNMDNLKQGMVSIFLAQALRTGQIVVKGSPERFRDFIHIDDVVAAFSRGLVHETDGAEVFDIGTGRRVLIGSLLEQLQELLPGTEVEIAGSTPGDQFGIYADTSHAERRLGFKAKVRLEDGLASMVARCRDAESLGG